MSALTIHPQVHTVDCGNEYTLTFTACWGVERDTHTHIDCGFWKRKHPHVHTADGGTVAQRHNALLSFWQRTSRKKGLHVCLALNAEKGFLIFKAKK
jgi:hypothetical protein